MLSLILLKLTLREVVADLPQDGGALVVLLLFVAFIAFIWHGSRQGAGAPRRPPPHPVREPHDPDPAGRDEPEPEEFLIDPARLSHAPDARRPHPEVR